GLRELALGGTAVGTGINCHPEFPSRAISKISAIVGIKFREAVDHFEAQASKDAAVHVSGALKALAVSLAKIANDLRWLASGPYGGLGEISLPDTQPGSSIMPGKVNPVICESVLQVAAHVVGCDATITACGQGGNFELNVMMPLLALKLLEAITFTASAAKVFAEKCIVGIVADEERCKELVEKSMALATALVPVIGYDAAAEIARESRRTGDPVREVARHRRLLPEERLAGILDPWRMTAPGLQGKGKN
ncbi:MAG TPA: lyase family protein, partial [Candidatus Binatia bacterium]